MKLFELVVEGRPRTKGSMRHVGRGRMVEDIDNGAWRETVTYRAAQAAGRGRWSALVGVPVAIDLAFTVTRPASTPASQLCPITRSSGDVDKLVRLIFDALTDARIVGDDSQFVELHTRKCYPNSHPKALPAAGVRLALWALDPAPLEDGDTRR